MKLLDKDGVCSVGELIQPGEVYINKQSPINTRDMVSNPHALPDNAFKPTPMSWKGVAGQACVVDRVLLTENEEGHRIFKVGLLAFSPVLPGLWSSLHHLYLLRCSH